MFNIVLHNPKIPPNTGNVIRLCANCGSHLHLIKPLGFSIDDKQLRRAGLDYHDAERLTIHENFEAFVKQQVNNRLFAIETCGEKPYSEAVFRPGDVFIFGAETVGLPNEVLSQIPRQQILKIPMLPNNRSLNLSNSVALVIYEAWRQLGFSHPTHSFSTQEDPCSNDR